VELVGGAGRPDQELAAHAQVAEQGVAGVERQPEVLAAPPGGVDPAAGEPIGEVGGPRQVPPDRTRVPYLDRVDAMSDGELLQAATDDLDLG
jgi:hypothetical protein